MVKETNMLNLHSCCPVPVSSRRSNKNHRYKCQLCTQTFRRRDGYDRHQFLRTGVYTYPCQEPNCSKAFTNRSHLVRHVRVNHIELSSTSRPNVWNCTHPDCPMKFSRKDTMNRHYQSKHIHGKPHVCDVCSESFWRKLQLKQHMMRHTDQYPHRCEQCGQGFVNLKSMRSHRCKRNAYVCSNCSKEFVRWLELITHQQLEHPVQFRCEECGKWFRTKRNLKLHAQAHLAKDVKEVYECPYDDCMRFYTYKNNLNAHVRLKHPRTSKEK
ncbi:LOW QUALITY PROTEIN: zinc finger protein 155-like [Anopheles moucheti]|uniref:LOW QUALITY PROTEIN: zinc finger protein 155-like n=1 Tax=Anopheles moucheti TaxID=186751 RepID=UPI0022F05070|nr:LOW QUALITY PROTEIN: zinc finger protein 155-like [Anopheles moucheti]